MRIRRIVSVLCAFMIVINFTTPSYATENQELLSPYKTRNQITLIQSKTDGTLSEIEHENERLLNNSEVISDASQKIVIAYPTEDSDIYKVDDKTYLIKIDGNSYMPASRIDIDTSSLSIAKSNAINNQIPTRIIEEITHVIEEQNNLDNNKFKVSVYAPKAFDYARYEYYYYNGYQLRDWVVKYTNLEIGKRWDNYDAHNTAHSLFNASITVAGLLVERVALFANAYGYLATALEVYKSFRGDVRYPSYGDVFHLSVVYDAITKSTEVYSPTRGWSFGANTKKVWLNYSHHSQYYRANGSWLDLNKSLNREIFSPNFRDPRQLAINWYQNMGYSDGMIEMNLYGTNFVLQ